VAAAVAASSTIDSPGDESIGPRHFVANPEITRLRRYRATTAAGVRYLTVQLSASGAILSAIVED